MHHGGGGHGGGRLIAGCGDSSETGTDSGTIDTAGAGAGPVSPGRHSPTSTWRYHSEWRIRRARDLVAVSGV